MALYVDIRKDFGGFVLETQFQTEAGVLGLLGESGSGKSMTLRCIAGIVTPDEGRIELDGVPFFDSKKRINLKPQQRQVGLLFQNYALFPNMTVRQNLLTGLRSREKNRERADSAVREMIRKFHLSGLENHRPAQLSGGQQQRTALARILLSRPRVLMLDEPFSALDELLKWHLELELGEILKEFGGTTLFVTHSRDEIYRICHQVIVMERGKSGPVIPVKQLFEAPETRAAAYLSGCKNYSEASLIPSGEVYARDWGVTLRASGAVPPGLSSVGIRSHYIRPALELEEDRCNIIRCRILRAIEDVFSYVVILRPVKAPGDARIRMDVSKEVWGACCLRRQSEEFLDIAISPKDILLLK